jgi:hypothetical protein
LALARKRACLAGEGRELGGEVFDVAGIGRRLEGGFRALSNKRMKLTKLSAAWLPGWTCRLMLAPVNGMDAGTASQLIPGVRPT